MLNRGHVIDALGHHARQFLQTGVTVHLQRIEIGMYRFGLRDAGLHLHVGLDLHLAQLVAQANDVFGEVEQGAALGTQFAFDAGARNADLAGFIDKAIDQIGAHAQRCGGGVGTLFRVDGDGSAIVGGCATRVDRRIRLDLTAREAVDVLAGDVHALFERVEQIRGDAIRGFKLAFQRVHMLAERHRAGHARAAL